MAGPSASQYTLYSSFDTQDTPNNQDSQETRLLDSQAAQPSSSQLPQSTPASSTRLTTALSDPSAPTDLQRASAFSRNAQLGDNPQSAAIVVPRHIYQADRGGSSVIRHLLEHHKVSKIGKIETGNKRQRLDLTLIDRLGLDANNPRDQAVINKLAGSYHHSTFRKLLVRWIVYDNVPFHQIESERFNKLLVYLQPRVEASIPCANSVRHWILEDYHLLKESVIAELQAAPGLIHISFDLWTSRNLLSLNGIVVHYVDAEYAAKTCLLALPEQDDSHTGLNIAAAVARVVEEYRIEAKLGYFMLDNASNNDVCMKELADRFNFNPLRRRLRCMGHIINLIAREALFGKDVNSFEIQTATSTELLDQLVLWRAKGPVSKLHNLVVWIYRSPQRKKRFYEAQGRVDRDLPKEDTGGQSTLLDLIQDNGTRWNSTFNMIKRGILLRNAIDELIDAEARRCARRLREGHKPKDIHGPAMSIFMDRLTVEDWGVLIQYRELLHPMERVTKSLEGRPGPSQASGNLWTVIAAFEHLLKKLKYAKGLYEHHPEDHFRVGIELAWQKANQYYALLDESPAYLAAVILHPKYKWQYIENRWRGRDDWIKAGRQRVHQLWTDEYSLRQAEPVVQRPTQEIDEFEADMAEGLVAGAANTTALDEYATWLEVEQVRCEDPIAYWVQQSTNYPKLARMALDLFSIPAMSSEPERIFSLAGLMVTDRRNRLNPDIVQAAQCIRSWEHHGVGAAAAALAEELEEGW